VAGWIPSRSKIEGADGKDVYLDPQVRNTGPRARPGDHRWADGGGPSPTRRRCAGLLMWGGACVCMATYLPWVAVRFRWGWWPRTGMQLTYAHFPPITIGYVALVLGGSAILLGRAEARKPGYAELAILPAGLTTFFLWFINSSVHGHYGDQMDSYGALGISLGPGYWLMMIGTVLVAWGVVVAVSTREYDGSLSVVVLEAELLSMDATTRDEQRAGSAHERSERSSSST
jgi:hypothetical protein